MLTSASSSLFTTMFRILAIAAAFTATQSLSAAEPIVPADAKLEKLFESRVLTEAEVLRCASFSFFKKWKPIRHFGQASCRLPMN